MMGYKNPKQYSENDSNTVRCRILVVYPHDNVADWELWLTATAQCHTTCCQPKEKIKIQSAVSNERVSLSHHCKVKKIVSGTIISQGLCVYISNNMHFHGTQIYHQYILKKFFPYDRHLFPRFCYKHLSFNIPHTCLLVHMGVSLYSQ